MNKNEWRLISEELPPNGEVVIGYDAKVSETFAVFRSNGVILRDDVNPMERPVVNITHWMPWPDPPPCPKPDAFQDWWSTLIPICGSDHRRIADGPWFNPKEARIVWDAAIASMKK